MDVAEEPEDIDSVEPKRGYWVERTRKRVREEHAKREADRLEAANKRREKEAAEKSADLKDVRDSFGQYEVHLAAIKRHVKHAVRQQHLDQFCWLFFSQDGTRVCLTETMPPRVFEEGRPEIYPFRFVHFIGWSVVFPAKEGVPFGYNRLLDAFHHDIKEWATSLGLEVSTTNWVSSMDVTRWVPPTDLCTAGYLTEKGRGIYLPFAPYDTRLPHDEAILLTRCLPQVEIGDLSLGVRVSLKSPPSSETSGGK